MLAMVAGFRGGGSCANDNECGRGLVACTDFNEDTADREITSAFVQHHKKKGPSKANSLELLWASSTPPYPTQSPPVECQQECFNYRGLCVGVAYRNGARSCGLKKKI